MKKNSEVIWSEVAGKAIVHKLNTLRLGERLVSKSKLPEKDVSSFGKKIKVAATKRFLS